MVHALLVLIGSELFVAILVVLIAIDLFLFLSILLRVIVVILIIIVVEHGLVLVLWLSFFGCFLVENIASYLVALLVHKTLLMRVVVGSGVVMRVLHANWDIHTVRVVLVAGTFGLMGLTPTESEIVTWLIGMVRLGLSLCARFRAPAEVESVLFFSD